MCLCPSESVLSLVERIDKPKGLPAGASVQLNQVVYLVTFNAPVIQAFLSRKTISCPSEQRSNQ
jgi:hypothetical protein